MTPLPGPPRRLAPHTAGSRSGAVRRRSPAPVWPASPYRPAAWHWAACYLLYVLVLYASYHTFWLWRTTLERVLPFLIQDKDWFPPTYLGAMTIIGLALFCIVVGSESHLRYGLITTYYRPGSYLLRLLWRFVHLALVMALVAGGAIAMQEWAFRSVL